MINLKNFNGFILNGDEEFVIVHKTGDIFINFQQGKNDMISFKVEQVPELIKALKELIKE